MWFQSGVGFVELGCGSWIGCTEKVVSGDVDVVGGVGVGGPSSYVGGGGSEGEFLYAEACEADWESGLCALLWREGGV